MDQRIRKKINNTDDRSWSSGFFPFFFFLPSLARVREYFPTLDFVLNFCLLSDTFFQSSLHIEAPLSLWIFAIKSRELAYLLVIEIRNNIILG